MKRLSRRTVLRGAIAGTTLALGLPLLDAMLPTTSRAEDKGKPIFGLVFWANGLPWHAGHGSAHAAEGHPDLWTPAATGHGYAPSPLLEPLARFEPTVVTGLEPHTILPDGAPGEADGHVRGFMVAMTGDRPRSELPNTAANLLTALRPTLDQVVARHPDFYADAEPRHRALHLGTSLARFHDWGHWNAISMNGPGSHNPPISDPTLLYQQLFGVRGAEASLPRRAALLDAVMDEADSLRGRLGAPDRARLDAHLEHLYEVQRRLDPIAATCEIPPEPSASEDFMEQTGILADLLAIGLGCEATRSFSFMLTSPGSTHIFSEVGVREGLHKTFHDGLWAESRDATLQQMKAFARLAAALEDHVDAAGNSLLDRALLYGTSELGEGWMHGLAELPVVMVGGAAGGLQRGVHLREVGGNLARAQLTALQALGLPFESFGFSGAETRDSYADLLA